MEYICPNEDIVLNYQTVAFGTIDSMYNILVNIVVLEAKYIIWKSWNYKKKYEHSEFFSENKFKTIKNKAEYWFN